MTTAASPCIVPIIMSVTFVHIKLSECNKTKASSTHAQVFAFTSVVLLESKKKKIIDTRVKGSIHGVWHLL